MPASYTRPAATPPTYLGTFTDFVDHLTWFSGGTAIAKSQYGIRKAAEVAYREFVQMYDWKYFQTDGRIITNAPYSTGTIQYTHSSRTVSLSGGSFPTWAPLGRISIDGKICEVETNPSATSLILSTTMNPGANVAAGRGYTLYQEVYPLPGDFRNLLGPVRATSWPMSYIPPEQWHQIDRISPNSGSPQYWTIWNAHSRFGQVGIALYPYPNEAGSIDFPYQRFARPISVTGYALADYTGTVTNSSTAVTGTNTTFSPRCVGSVLRFGTTSAVPTGISGTNPYAEQQIITTYTSGTSLTLDAAPSVTQTAVKFTISDPIDLPEYMHTAFLRRCELEATTLLRLAHPEIAAANWHGSLELALAADNSARGREASGGSGGVDRSWWRGSLNLESY